MGPLVALWCVLKEFWKARPKISRRSTLEQIFLWRDSIFDTLESVLRWYTEHQYFQRLLDTRAMTR